MDTSLYEKNLDIMYGPNKDLLFDACKYARNLTVSIPANFSVALGYTMPPDRMGSAYIPARFKSLHIESIAHESQTGDVFCLTGLCEADLYSRNWDNPQYKMYRFEAHYDTKSRKGTMQFFSV
jgi:hypothetical protein